MIWYLCQFCRLSTSPWNVNLVILCVFVIPRCSFLPLSLAWCRRRSPKQTKPSTSKGKGTRRRRRRAPVRVSLRSRPAAGLITCHWSDLDCMHCLDITLGGSRSPFSSRLSVSLLDPPWPTGLIIWEDLSPFSSSFNFSITHDNH